MTRKDRIIRSRYYVEGEGWKTEDERLPSATLIEAHAAASSRALELDAEYAGGHFWTVDVHTEGSDLGSAGQLFHGRLA